MRILIVDDHPIFREALGSLLERFYPGAAVFEVSSVGEAIGVLTQYVEFDLIMLDAFVPSEDEVMGLALLLEKAPQTPVVIMSGANNADFAHKLIEQGARGYIAKSAGAGEVKNALHLILAGEIYISPSLLAGKESWAVAEPEDESMSAEPETDDLAGVAGLTPRQQAVLRLMAKGLPNKSIARELHCSDGTVKLHVSAILRALHARNRTEAVLAVSHLKVS